MRRRSYRASERGSWLGRVFRRLVMLALVAVGICCLVTAPVETVSVLHHVASSLSALFHRI